MNVFSRSWKLTKLSFGVIKKDKELFAFPVLSFVFSVLFLLAVFVSSFFGGLYSLSSGFEYFSYIEYFIFFLSYLGLSFIATFFSACVVYTAGIRFRGKNATFGESIGFALKRVDKIFLWSVFSATIGLILKIIESLARNIKGVGRVVLFIFNSVFGLLWSVLTIFVVQGIVYNNLGPFSAIKKSALVLKETWGESLIKYFGFGVVQFLFVFAGIVIGAILMYLGFVTGGVYILFGFAVLMFLYILAVLLIFGIASQIYNSALYVYATTGKIPEGYDEDIMVNAFIKKSKKSVFSALRQ